MNQASSKGEVNEPPNHYTVKPEEGMFPWIYAIWALGVLLLLLQFGWHWWWTKQTRRRSQRISPSSLAPELQQLSSRFPKTQLIEG
ncbi:MAG: hypothetical protein AAGF89_00765, partial [Bacteroidota bacterium]